MKKLRKIAGYTLAAIAAAGLALCVKFYATTFPVVIVFTNDLHGNFMPRKDGEGGAAATAAFLKKLPADRLLLDAGDFFQGTPESDLSLGKNTVLVMNRLGYDAAAVGNHEFDYGRKNLADLARAAKFPLLSANIRDNKTGRSPDFIKPYIIKEVRGARIAVFGLTSERTPQMSMPANVAGLVFEDPAGEALSVVSELAASADVIVALTHLGYEKDARAFCGDRYLAANVEGIDLIIGGHTHTALRGKKIGKTVVAQTGGGWRSVGRIVLRLDKKTKRPRLVSAKAVKISAAKFGEDAEVKALVERLSAATSKKLSAVIGRAGADLTRARDKESNIGDLLADIMREAGRADIALHNSGGIRADFKKGPLTLGDIYAVNPFDNTVVTMKLSGRNIRRLMEKSFKGTQGLLQISGMRVSYDRGSQKLDILVGESVKRGVPLADDKLYFVATNSFLAAGGDGYSEFTEGQSARDTGVKFRDAVTEYLLKAGTIPAKRGMPDGRIEIK